MFRKNNNQNTPSERVSRELYYDAITASISSYIKRTNKTKIIFQIVIGTISCLLLVAITVAFIFLITHVLMYGQAWQLESSTIIATIITSSATYAASLIGTLAIVVNYMFNKNDISDHSALLKSFLESAAAKDNPIIEEKSVSRIAENSGLLSFVKDENSNSVEEENKHGRL